MIPRVFFKIIVVNYFIALWYLTIYKAYEGASCKENSGHKQSRRCLEFFDDNFLTEVIEEMRRGPVLLNLIVTNKEELFRNAKAGTGLH